jgi:hypothetical protein
MLSILDHVQSKNCTLDYPEGKGSKLFRYTHTQTHTHTHIYTHTHTQTHTHIHTHTHTHTHTLTNMHDVIFGKSWILGYEFSRYVTSQNKWYLINTAMKTIKLDLKFINSTVRNRSLIYHNCLHYFISSSKLWHPRAIHIILNLLWQWGWNSQDRGVLNS